MSRARRSPDPCAQADEKEVTFRVKDLTLRVFWTTIKDGEDPNTIQRAREIADIVCSGCGYGHKAEGWINDALDTLSKGARIVEADDG